MITSQFSNELNPTTRGKGKESDDRRLAREPDTPEGMPNPTRKAPEVHEAK